MSRHLMLSVIHHVDDASTLLDGANLLLHETVEALGRLSTVSSVIFDEYLHSRPLRIDHPVYAAADPFAHHMLADRTHADGSQPIVRHVQTGAWAGYLLQEAVCVPLEREDDVVLYPSFYCRESYRRWFGDHWRGHHLVSYQRAETAARVNSRAPFAAGYVGRLSQDKNLEDALHTFALLRERNTRARFVLVGDVDAEHYARDEILDLIGSLGLADCCVWLGPLPHTEALATIRNMAVLLFPSTSTVESYGRVVAEALSLGTRCVAARHGAMPELLAEHSLAPVLPSTNRRFSCYSNAPVGKVDARDLLAAYDAVVAMPVLKACENHTKADGLACGFAQIAENPLTGHAQGALGKLENLPCYDTSEALEVEHLLREHLLAACDPQRRALVCTELLRRSSNPERTGRFVRRVSDGPLRLGALGDWALESGHLVGFNPSLVLED